LCFTLHNYDLQHEGLHGGISTEGELSSMAEDAPATLNMVIDDVSWELFEEWFQERYLSEEFVEHHLNEFNSLQQGICMCPSTRPIFGAASVCSTPFFQET
jgi:hypothetical protein